MRASPLSIASIALNVVLLGALIVTWRLDSEPGQASSPSPNASGTAASGDLAILFAKARGQGVSEEMAYRLALANARATAANVVVDEYWKPAPLRSEALHEAEYNSVVATRDLLLKSFGPEAQSQAAFAEVFEPLRQRFGFLSTDKQIRLQQILFETGEDGAGFSGRNSPNRNERSTRVRALLDDTEFQEYQLRESMLAARLANSGMDFTEAEFRAAHAAAATVAAGNTRADPLRAAMPAIKRVLSPQRFAELERVQDPTYRWLRSGAARFGANQDVTIEAYELIRDTHQRALELKGKSTTAAARTELIETRDKQLRKILGEQMFDFIAPRLRASAQGGAQWPGDPAAAFVPMR